MSKVSPNTLMNKGFLEDIKEKKMREHFNRLVYKQIFPFLFLLSFTYTLNYPQVHPPLYRTHKSQSLLSPHNAYPNRASQQKISHFHIHNLIRVKIKKFHRTILFHANIYILFSISLPIYNQSYNLMKKLFAFIALGLLVSEAQSSVFSTNQVDGLNNVIHYGQYNRISGNDNQVLGYENRINGQGNAALGLNNQLMGVGNLVAGVGNTISGKNNLVGGHGNIVVGSDASEQEKALINQKMMNMFASRGFNGVPGLAVASSQVSESARDSSAVFSTSKDNKNNNLQPQALQTLADPEPQPTQPIKVDNPKKPQEVPTQPVVSDRVQKKEEKVLPRPEIKDKIPTKTSEAYLVETKQNQYDYNRADNAEEMPVEDLTFFDQSKSKIKDSKSNSPNSSPVTQPLNTVPVQSVSQTQQEPRKVVTALPVEPVQQKTEVLVKPDLIVVQPQVKPEPKPVDVVKTEVKVVEAPKPTPVTQPTLPVVAQQNQVQAQQNQVQAQQNQVQAQQNQVQAQQNQVQAQQNQVQAQENQVQAQENRQQVTTTQKVDAPKQDFGFKFYVNDGSSTESSSRTTTTQVSSRYSRTARTFDQVPEVVTVPPVRSSNLRQEDAPRTQVPRAVDSTPSSNNNINDFRVVQPNLGAQDTRQGVSSSFSSSTVGSANLVSTNSVNRGGLTQNFGFSSSSDNSWNAPVSSSASIPDKYRRDSSNGVIQPPVVITTTSTVVTSSVPSSLSSSTPKLVPKTANDLANSYISSGNPNVVFLSNDQGFGGSSNSVRLSGQRDYFRN